MTRGRPSSYWSPLSRSIPAPCRPDEIVLSLDEETSLQPRPRLHPTKPAQPGGRSRIEHEYRAMGR